MPIYPLKIVTGLSGAAAVALGAFGAHALKGSLEASGMTAVWQTAVQYHLAHSIALLVAVGIPTWRRAAWAWVAGILLFSGSLYLLALGGPRWLGPITPLGGVALIGGWVLVLLDGFRSPSQRT